MWNKRMVWLSIFIIIAVGTITISTGCSIMQDKKDKESVQAAVAQFYTALNAMFNGDLAPMDAVWSHADDVTYMGPTGGYRVGWQQVRADWQQQAEQKLGGMVKPEEVRITMSENLAVVHNYEKGENTNTQGNPAKVSIRATNVFRKEGGKWKMIGHHTDLLPFLLKN
jgi:ketosteroid isomerase-like protein